MASFQARSVENPQTGFFAAWWALPIRTVETVYKFCSGIFFFLFAKINLCLLKISRVNAV